MKPITAGVAKGLLTALIVALYVGTQMPGAWRDGIQQALSSPIALSSPAHVFLFLCIAFVAAIPPLQWPLSRILWVACLLAVTTEGLQFFAIDRHPRLRDIGFDFAGVFLGLALAYLIGGRRKWSARR